MMNLNIVASREWSNFWMADTREFDAKPLMESADIGFPSKSEKIKRFTQISA
jgi:hypothetical protein